jgi:hypothetical protein
MQNFMKVSLALVCLAIIFLSGQRVSFGTGEGRAKGNAQRLSKALGIHRPFWAPNRIGDYITNDGQFVSHIPKGAAGMEWPVGSGKTIGFASGLWLAGMKDGQIATAVAEYTSEFQPGTVVGHAIGHAGTPANPQDSRFKVYIINDDDLANPSGNPDYLNWPVMDGAPVTENNKPLLLGTSTAWAVFNDFNDSLHTQQFMTKSMGVEVQMTAWAFDRADPFGDMMFFKFRFINKSGKNISDAYAAFWTDIDIGDARDLVGCDTTLSLGFQYKKQNDGVYGANPPAIGYKLLQGPIVPSPGDTAVVSGKKVPDFRNLPMTSFDKFVCGGQIEFSCPETGVEAYNFMQGLNKFGQAFIDSTTGLTTKFWHPGDPVAGTGWLDGQPRDKYILISSGPFTFVDGDTQEVVLAIIIAQGSIGLESVRLVKQNVALAEMAYQNQWVITAVQETRAEAPRGYVVSQNYPNPFNPSTSFEFSIPRDEFVSLKIYNVFGEEVATVVKEKLLAGRHKIEWSAAGLPSGIYLYRFQAGAFAQTRKLTLLK